MKYQAKSSRVETLGIARSEEPLVDEASTAYREFSLRLQRSLRRLETRFSEFHRRPTQRPPRLQGRSL
ncbi:MAG: hypothetical protein KDA42_08025 [Planctomycetales bacterium]|nr:hypothetical protein [Planctomycetales bacterium]